MLNETVETLVSMIVSALKREKQRCLFLLTASDQKEEILFEELIRLLEMFPDSRICIDRMPDDVFASIRGDERCSKKFIQSRSDIRQEVLLADIIAAVSFDLSTMQKVSLGLCDDNVTFACMPVLSVQAENRGPRTGVYS